MCDMYTQFALRYLLCYTVALLALLLVVGVFHVLRGANGGQAMTMVFDKLGIWLVLFLLPVIVYPAICS